MSHVYAFFGSYTATLTVEDNNEPAKTSTTSTVIQVNLGNHAPIAHAGGTYVVDLGTGVTLNGCLSSDPDAAAGDCITQYQWLVADSLLLTSTTPSVELTASQIDALGIERSRCG